MIRQYLNFKIGNMAIRCYKGWLAYELQIGPLVIQWCHSGQRFQGKRLLFWKDTYGYWPWGGK